MKIDRLETHDRFQHLKRQDFDIGKTCQDIIDQKPFGSHAFYIFAHKRELAWDEKISLMNTGMFKTPEEVPTHRLIWQPRLTKPMPQENSMLFKAYPGSDNVKVIWIIPQRELWEQFEKGKMTEDEIIWTSIDTFKKDPRKLGEPEQDDLPDAAIEEIYRDISQKKKGFVPIIGRS